MEKATETRHLPDHPSFRESLDSLYSLDIQTISKIFEMLNTRLSQFTTKNIIEEHGVDIDTAPDVREVICFLIHYYGHDPDDVASLKKQLIERGGSEEKVSLIVDKITNLSPKGIKLANIIWESESGNYELEHLFGILLGITYSMQDSNGVLFLLSSSL